MCMIQLDGLPQSKKNIYIYTGTKLKTFKKHKITLQNGNHGLMTPWRIQNVVHCHSCCKICFIYVCYTTFVLVTPVTAWRNGGFVPFSFFSWMSALKFDCNTHPQKLRIEQPAKMTFNYTKLTCHCNQTCQISIKI